MNRKLLILAATGVLAVAAALVARGAATGAPPATPDVAATSTPPPQGGAVSPGGASSGEGDFLVLPADAAHEEPADDAGAVGPVKGEADGGEEEGEGADGTEGTGLPAAFGGWLRSGSLPMCGRAGEVELRAAPGSEVKKGGSLPSCEEGYREYPSVNLFAVGPRDGDWIRVGEGWAPIDEVRSAETLLVDGREYWHDLFNATVARVDGRQIVVSGDTDPCAAEVCQSGHGLWEQEEQIKARYAAEHPGGLPPEVQTRLEKEVAEMNEAAEREWEAAQKAAQGRARQERTLKLPAAAAPAGPPTVEVSGGSYLCCT